MYISRQIFKEIQHNLLKNNNITGILGARQVGKTTLLNKLKAELNTDRKNIFSYNFDKTELRRQIKENPSYILKDIESSLNTSLPQAKELIYLFIDEAQKISAIFDFLKLLFDEYPDKIKIIISGSSSLTLLKHSTESLAGRIRFFHLYPLTIREIINHHLQSDSSSAIVPLLEGKADLSLLKERQSQIYRKREQFDPFWQNLILFGCLPAVVAEPHKTEKIQYIKNFIATYLERDIRALKEVGDIDLFSKILKSFALQDSQLLNLAKFSGDFGLSRDTLRKYFTILKETFVASSFPPFTQGNRQKTIKSQKIIFFDNGVINYFSKIDQLEQLSATDKIGQIFENLIINNITRNIINLPMPPDLSFWRDYNGHEIDLISFKNNQIIPIEITYAKKVIQPKIRNFKAFFNKYPDSSYGAIIYGGELSALKIADKDIYLVPYWLL